MSPKRKAARTPTPTPTIEPVAGIRIDSFDHYPDGLITNAYAEWNAKYDTPGLAISALWRAYGGSLFARNHKGWTGDPDDGPMDIKSATKNGSQIFRVITHEPNVGPDLRVDFDLNIIKQVSSANYPAVSWDGVHVLFRAQPLTPAGILELYYCSIARRDGVIMFKKKKPGGTEGGGTYYPLNNEYEQRTKYPHPIPFGTNRHITIECATTTLGVQMIASIDGIEVCRAIDPGAVGGPPILLPGHVGIRGDNTEFEFDNFTVSQ